MSLEPLLRDNKNRFVILPIKYQDMWDMYQTHRKAIWNESEIDIASDLYDWNNKLTPDEKHFILYILAFFAGSDGIVIENLGTRFLKEIQIPEARQFYSVQMFMEGIHSTVYAQLIDTFIINAKEKDELFRAIETIPAVQQKAEWALKWIDSDNSFAERLVAFACVEGIFFSGSFCCIFWLNERGLMKEGLSKSNTFIAADEALHRDFAVLLYSKYIVNKLSDKVIHEIVRDAVEIEEFFITKCLDCRLIGMNSEMMIEYIHFVANLLLRDLGHPVLYPGAKQPFTCMESINYDKKQNFFEGRVTSYQMTVEKTECDENDTLSFDAQF